MAIVYNSNQVKYGDRGYLDAKMQPVENLAALPTDITEVFEGMSVVVLNDGSGQPHEYWRVGGQWVKKDNGGSGDISALTEKIEAVSASVETLDTTVDAMSDKLDGIEVGAQKNVQSDWNESDLNSDAYIKNKPDVSSFVTKDVDDLTNYFNKEQTQERDDELLDAAADYADGVATALTVQIDNALAEAKAYVDGKDFATESDIDAKVSIEEQRALSAETALRESINEATGGLDDEVSARTAADNILNEAILSETSARTEADDELRASIEAEAEARVFAVSALTGDLAGEVSARISSDSELRDNIETEVSARTAADDELREAIEVVENDLLTKQDVITPGAALSFSGDVLNVLVDGTTIKVDEQTNKLHVIGGGGGGGSYIPGDYIDINDDVISVTGITPSDYATHDELAEQTSALTEYVDSQDFANHTELNEVRIGAIMAATAWTENQHYAKEQDVIDTVADLIVAINEAEANAISASTKYTDEAISAITPSGDVEAEKERAISAETELQEAIDAEALRATSAETALQTAITTESQRAKDAERALQSNIDEEQSRATLFETKLEEDIEAETARAISAETALQDMVADEFARANSAELDLHNDITANTAAINAEESRAMGVEAEIYSAVTSMASDVEAETERAIAAESALTTALESKLDASALTEYATTSEVQGMITAATDDMATETWVDEQGYLTEHQSLSAYSTTVEMNQAINDAVSGISSVLTSAITTTVAVGNVPSGTTFSAGTSIELILREIFMGGETPTGVTSYGYYGTLTEGHELWEEDPLPEEEFNEANVKAKLIRTVGTITASDVLNITVTAGDTQILFAVPATIAMDTAVDTTNNVPYTNALDGTVPITMDSLPYNVYYFYTAAGFGSFNMRITLKNA